MAVEIEAERKQTQKTSKKKLTVTGLFHLNFRRKLGRMQEGEGKRGDGQWARPHDLVCLGDKNRAISWRWFSHRTCIHTNFTHTHTHTEHHYGEQCAACGLLGPGETRANEANSNLLASGVKVIHFCPIPYAAWWESGRESGGGRGEATGKEVRAFKRRCKLNQHAYPFDTISQITLLYKNEHQR